MVNFAFDFVNNGVPHPNYVADRNIQPGTSEWKQLSTIWPYAEPLHFLEYLDQEHIEYCVYTAEDAPVNSLYPVSLSFFDFDLNWFTMLWDRPALSRLQNRELKIWFFYSEADNPFRIKKHLEYMAVEQGIDPEQILFTSANSSAQTIKNFSYFADDELLYRLRNKSPATRFHSEYRSKKFTALVRTHKPWRATTMAKLWQMDIHKCSYFSYNNIITVKDMDTNPIAEDLFHTRHLTNEFLEQCPFTADELDYDLHNDYSTTVSEHFANSYCNIVLETHLDTEGSGGVFITEKTFKPIKHCQLFVIFGAAGTIQQLRDFGYKTFDTWIDHGYDAILDNNQRWEAILQEIARLNSADLHSIYQMCKKDLIHNQQLFLSSKAERLNTLLGKIL